MPSMPRMDLKSEEIAFHILGTPPNLRKQKKTKKEKVQDKRLVFEETVRVR